MGWHLDLGSRHAEPNRGRTPGRDGERTTPRLADPIPRHPHRSALRRTRLPRRCLRPGLRRHRRTDTDAGTTQGAGSVVARHGGVTSHAGRSSHPLPRPPRAARRPLPAVQGPARHTRADRSSTPAGTTARSQPTGGPVTVRLATPAEQARMSWHARAKYAQRLAAHHRTQANEAQAVADVMDHRSPVVSAAFARLIAELNTALEEDARRKQAKRRAAARAAGRTTVLTDAGRAAVRANLDRAKGVWWERRATLRAEAHRMFASGRRSY